MKVPAYELVDNLHKLKCVIEDSESYWLKSSGYQIAFRFKNTNIYILIHEQQNYWMFVQDFFILPKEEVFDKLRDQEYFYEILTTLNWLF